MTLTQQRQLLRQTVDAIQLSALALTVESLVAMGLPKNKAVYYVARAKGLNAADVTALIKLL